MVRIAGYGWVVRLYARRGPRPACLLAAYGAAVAALGYGLLSGVWALLLAHLLWGLCYAALNIAAQALPTAEPAGAARRSGRSRAIIAVGPMLGMLGGAALSQVAGPRPAFLVLAAPALLAIPFALRLPGDPEADSERAPGGPPLAVLLSLAAAVGLAMVGIGLLWSGAVLVMLLRGLIQPLPAPVAAADNPGPARVPALAKMATWRDLGAGAGPLLAGLLLPVLPASLLYGGAAVLVAATAIGVAGRRA